MTDHGLLDLDANVSGVDGMYLDERYCGTYTVNSTYDCCLPLGWNLVVGGKRVEVLPPSEPLAQEFHEGNADAATRRAIARVAVELSRRREK